MKKYSNDQLKEIYKALFWVDCGDLWNVVNTELAKRLGKDEYFKFIHNN